MNRGVRLREQSQLAFGFHGVTRSAAALEAVDDKKVTPSSRPRRILVVGEVGDGKSTLINALRDPEKSDEAKAGKKARGVFKQISEFSASPPTPK